MLGPGLPAFVLQFYIDVSILFYPAKAFVIRRQVPPSGLQRSLLDLKRTVFLLFVLFCFVIFAHLSVTPVVQGAVEFQDRLLSRKCEACLGAKRAEWCLRS